MQRTSYMGRARGLPCSLQAHHPPRISKVFTSPSFRVCTESLFRRYDWLIIGHWWLNSISSPLPLPRGEAEWGLKCQPSHLLVGSSGSQSLSLLIWSLPKCYLINSGMVERGLLRITKDTFPGMGRKNKYILLNHSITVCSPPAVAAPRVSHSVGSSVSL